MNGKLSLAAAHVLVHSGDIFAASGLIKLIKLYRPSLKVYHIRRAEEMRQVKNNRLRLVVGIATDATNVGDMSHLFDNMRKENADLPCVLLGDSGNSLLSALFPEIPVMGLHASMTEIFEFLASNLARKNRLPQRRTTTPLLTLRQREVLRMLACGASAQQVSDSLGISLKTAYVHRRDILMRLNICPTYYRGMFTE
ncbi:helix-turn-helix transcriptional regulator [Kosakonia sp. MUSA4]|uniref:helix-turn-helix transcriptional regulator n=1 Tax=Kosakonia sp. MUSA4 TaxID=2067958 RepID=UPI00159A1D56|nr:helix-turn-helix transcriptional regulator [Kosakonia sp. MUSA4]QJT82082.1 hypothetical protein C0557_19390 [Kosakonia sp. MUSA4]